MKTIYVIAGTITLALGILGIFLPLLPTTPFLLLSAALYFKSSPRLYEWLITHPSLGAYLLNYREKRAITLQAKVTSLILLWVTILISIIFVAESLWLRILLGVILAGVTTHILMFRTLKRSETIRFIRIKDCQSVTDPAALAQRIREEYYDLREQPADKGHRHDRYFIKTGRDNVGYISVCSDNSGTSPHRIYILPEHRSSGYEAEAVAFLENICRAREYPTLCLYVENDDDTVTEIYEGLGFEKSEVPQIMFIKTTGGNSSGKRYK